MYLDGLLSSRRFFFFSILFMYFGMSSTEISQVKEVPSYVVNFLVSPLSPFQVFEGESSYFNLILSNSTFAESSNSEISNGSLILQLALEHSSIAQVTENASLLFSPFLKEEEKEWKVRVEGIKLGKTSLSMYVAGNSLSDITITYPDYEVEVLRKVRLLDLIFNYGIAVMIAFNVMMLGCQLQWPVIRELLKSPSSIIIGSCCQFLGMPLLAFGLAAGFRLQVEHAIGLLIIGCCPGGGLSNFFCYLLDGHLALSMTMTFVSTLLALGLMPLNLFVYTRYWHEGRTRFPVPFIQVFVSLALFCIPVAIGMYLRHKKPEWAFKVMKMIRPIGLFLVVVICGIGIYSNIYLVHHITIKNLATGLLLPSIGFIFGGLVAKILRREKSHSVTIAIETGIQNAALAIGLIQMAFRQPDADLMAIMPVLASMGQFIICFFAYCFYLITKKISHRKKINTPIGCFEINWCCTRKPNKQVGNISSQVEDELPSNENQYLSNNTEETFIISNKLPNDAVRELVTYENKVLFSESETNV